MLREVSSELLTKDELADVRAMARQLARHHQSFVKIGAPKKIEQGTLLYGIAEIFIRFTDQNVHPDNLPHAASSFFIQFARAALAPFFAPTEVSAKAIANRWQRHKTTVKKLRKKARKSRAKASDDGSIQASLRGGHRNPVK